jgi:hypothetical protein
MQEIRVLKENGYEKRNYWTVLIVAFDNTVDLLIRNVEVKDRGTE